MKSRLRCAAAAMLFSVTSLLGCGAPAKDPADNVLAGLRAADLNEIRAEYDAATATLRLKGIVANQSERNRALEVAMGIVGPSVTIANEATIRELAVAAETSDERIKHDVQKLLDRDRRLRKRTIRVDISSGIVRLTGNVAFVAERNRAARLARSVSDVKDVNNELKVKSRRRSQRS